MKDRGVVALYSLIYRGMLIFDYFYLNMLIVGIAAAKIAATT